MESKPEFTIRESTTVKELTACVALQREIFALPEIEISPVRHFIVTKNAGGFTLGAFTPENELAGFVLSVPAFLGNNKFFYSHMTAVKEKFQSFGIGARLKWAQREMALSKSVNFIKWTFQPVQARNAFFNLEKLGAIVREYHPNFYGTDYSTAHETNGNLGIDSDRLFAEWHLESEKVKQIAAGGAFVEKAEPAAQIAIPADWTALVRSDPNEALAVQLRVRTEFQNAFASGLVGRGFVRDENEPHFLLYEN